jgi:hypothetical protein
MLISSKRASRSGFFRFARRCYGLTNLGRFFQRITLGLMGEHWFSPWRQPAH